MKRTLILLLTASALLACAQSKEAEPDSWGSTITEAKEQPE